MLLATKRLGKNKVPRYVYQCTGCSQTFETVHSFDERYETCSEVNADCDCSATCSVVRVPQNINYMKKQQKKQKVGDLVKKHIENTKEEVKQYKEEMINWSPEN